MITFGAMATISEDFGGRTRLRRATGDGALCSLGDQEDTRRGLSFRRESEGIPRRPERRLGLIERYRPRRRSDGAPARDRRVERGQLVRGSSRISTVPPASK